MSQSENSQAFLGLTAEIISAHVKNNHVDAADLPLLIEQVYLALRNAGAPAPVAKAPAPAPEPERQAPVVSIKKSIFPDYIICLEDGRKMKTLKRYLRTTYNMTPEQYREKWDLPAEYPMVAPSYAEHRSVLAKQTGLGRKSAAATVAKSAPVAPAPPIAPVVVTPAVVAPPVAARTVVAEAVVAPEPPPAPAPRPARPIIEAPLRERRNDHTVASVFSNFPGASSAQQDAPEEPGESEDRKPRRKPFSKQLARGMRR
jgi:predicted transcriptional regulator